MSYLDRVRERLEGGVRINPALSVPVGETELGHGQEDTAPDKYANYLATSNDVYSAAMLRAKSLSKLHYTVIGNRTGAEQDEGPLVDLLDQPNPFYTGLKLKMVTELSMAIWGQAYWVMDRGQAGTGRPRELWYVRPTRMRPVPHPTEFISGFKFYPEDGGEPRPFLPDEVVWFAYPNLNDEWTGLAPMAAVRLAADVASASMKSNRNLFAQGLMPGGMVMPPDDKTSFDDDQAKELEKLLEKRFKGVDKAHRWAVLKYFFKIEHQSITPRDAEFIEGMNLSFRHVCRGMGVPAPLLGDGEFATLANLRVYERQLWEHTMEFQAEFMSAEINRQAVPHFPSVSHVAFDLSNVVALQEDETVKWSREKEQLREGTVTINEWREDNGLEAVAWGDVWWAPANYLPVSDEQTASEFLKDEDDERTYGSPVHAALWQRRVDSYQREEDAFTSTLRGLFDEQRAVVLRALRKDSQAAANDPFNQPEWIRKFQEAGRPRIGALVEKAIELGAEEVGGRGVVDDLKGSPGVLRAIQFQTQQFAKRVNTTTHQALNNSLRNGLGNGESIAKLADRVAKVMGDRMQSGARTIAQSEVTRAVTTGQLTAYREFGVTSKQWLSALIDTTRDSHRALHGKTIPLDEDFAVGACSGEGPGRTGCGEEDVNCLCTLRPIMERAALPALTIGMGANGHRVVDDLQLLLESLTVAA